MKYLISNEQDMRHLVIQLLSKLGGRTTKLGGNATVLALNGELGAGKTTFTKSLAKELGIIEHITSPTFVIQKSYKIPANKIYKKLVHIDVYRFEESREAHVLDLQKTVENPENLLIIEWANNIKEALPVDALQILFTYKDENTREVSIQG